MVSYVHSQEKRDAISLMSNTGIYKNRTPPISNIHASDSRFILNSVIHFQKIENQESEKLFLEITKVSLYKNPQKKAFSKVEERVDEGII